MTIQWMIPSLIALYSSFKRLDPVPVFVVRRIAYSTHSRMYNQGQYIIISIRVEIVVFKLNMQTICTS